MVPFEAVGEGVQVGQVVGADSDDSGLVTHSSKTGQGCLAARRSCRSSGPCLRQWVGRHDRPAARTRREAAGQ